MMVAVAAADQDPEQFKDPDAVDVARTLNRQIAFGRGIHYCLGAPLARLEGEIAFGTLLRRMPNLHLTIPRESVPWRGSLLLRGVAKLPVAF